MLQLSVMVRLVHGGLNGIHAVVKAYICVIAGDDGQVDAIALYAFGQSAVCLWAPMRTISITISDLRPQGRLRRPYHDSGRSGSSSSLFCHPGTSVRDNGVVHFLSNLNDHRALPPPQNFLCDPRSQTAHARHPDGLLMPRNARQRNPGLISNYVAKGKDSASAAGAPLGGRRFSTAQHITARHSTA